VVTLVLTLEITDFEVEPFANEQEALEFLEQNARKAFDE